MAVSEFRRGLPPGALANLKTMPPWWRDVLAYRFTDPAGLTRPLLIALRDGYFNVYVEGQSVLKVGFDTRRAGEVRLRGEIHPKYVQGSNGGDRNIMFDGVRVTTRDGTVVATYDGPETLRSWVEAAQGYAGDEKKGVAVIAANHPEVIDVEMALPADEPTVASEVKVANRMDIVALERAANGGVQLAFYEAKLFSNTELRADNLQPRVLTQLRRYRDYVSAPKRREQVVEAYRNACSLLLEIGEMRGTRPAPLISEVADGAHLDLDPEPRLVVFGHKPEQITAGAAWQRHAEALEEQGTHLLLALSAGDVKLRAR